MKYSIALVAFAATLTAAVPHFERRRFGQEQAPAQIIGAAGALFNDGTNAGKMAEFAGRSIGTVLGAADPCGIYDLGDEMITFVQGKLTGDALIQYVDIVRDAIAVEKNFNPFGADKRASICLDATKPASGELRGILPLVDPVLVGAADSNTKTVANNLGIKNNGTVGITQALGKSIGQQMIDVIGFSDFQKSETLAAGGAATAPATENPAGTPPNAGTPPTAGNPADPAGESAADVIARIEANLAALKLACAADGDAAAPPAGGAAPPAGNPQTAAATQGNLQKSTSALGGIPPPTVTNDGSDRPFKVENNDSFLNVAAALTRSCDVQANQCQNKFNSANRGDLKEGDCDGQRTTCNAANAA